jgi:hypothetical protein
LPRPLARASDDRAQAGEPGARVGAKLKQDLREGTVRLEQILATGADYLASAEVFDLLVTVPKIGLVQSGPAAHHRPRQPVQDRRRALSERQRARLIELLSR